MYWSQTESSKWSLDCVSTGLAPPPRTRVAPHCVCRHATITARGTHYLMLCANLHSRVHQLPPLGSSVPESLLFFFLFFFSFLLVLLAWDLPPGLALQDGVLFLLAFRLAFVVYLDENEPRRLHKHSLGVSIRPLSLRFSDRPDPSFRAKLFPSRFARLMAHSLLLTARSSRVSALAAADVSAAADAPSLFALRRR